MIHSRAKETVRQILEAAGFDVEDGDSRVDLLGVRGRECVVVFCSDEYSEITEFCQTRFSLKLDGKPVECIRLVVTLSDIQVEGCIVWGPEEIVDYAGMAALAQIEGDILELPLDVDYIEEEEVPPAPEGPSIPHLPVMVTEERAKKTAGIEGALLLRFVPHWAYSWKSTGEKIYKSHVISFEGSGEGATNAVNGTDAELTAELVQTDNAPAGADVLVPRIARKEVEERVREEVRTSLTQRVRISQREGDTISYEDRELMPDREGIGIDIQLVYLPVWQIKGRKIVEIDAYTGTVLLEPMDDGVELI